MKKILKHIIGLFYPERCPYCDKTVKSGEIACPICSALFPEISYTHYAKGGFPCFSPFFYQGRYAEAVKNFKFHNRTDYAEKLAAKLVESVRSQNGGMKYDLITYVPMFDKKEKRRGYNQSKLLAEEAAELFGQKASTLIIKHRDNREQHLCKGLAQRRENVKGVYKAVNRDAIKGKSILVIDDILTTGYTLGECCKVLRRAGAGTIHCATVCAKTI